MYLSFKTTYITFYNNKILPSGLNNFKVLIKVPLRQSSLYKYRVQNSRAATETML